MNHSLTESLWFCLPYMAIREPTQGVEWSRWRSVFVSRFGNLHARVRCQVRRFETHIRHLSRYGSTTTQTHIEKACAANS